MLSASLKSIHKNRSVCFYSSLWCHKRKNKTVDERVHVIQFWFPAEQQTSFDDRRRHPHHHHRCYYQPLLLGHARHCEHHSTVSNICRDLVITSSFRHDSINSSMVITPSWFRSSLRKTRSICSLAFLSSSTWWARRPINSCTATTISESSPRLMQPSPFMS